MNAIFHRLLLATEHTEFDAGAERVALAMARHCELPLAAVIPLVSNPEFEAVAPQLAAKNEAEAMGRKKALQEIARADGVALETAVRRGDEPWQEIVRAAAEQRADLLITRRRGKRGFLANLLVGDMVSKLAAHAPCSVLMVPRGAQMWRQGLLAAIDGSPTAERVVAVAIGVAAQCALPLTFVRVAPDAERGAAEEALARAVRAAEAAGVDATGEVLGGKIHTAVIDALRRSAADLLIVGLIGEEPIERFTLGSHARKLIALAETPVLVVKPEAGD